MMKGTETLKFSAKDARHATRWLVTTAWPSEPLSFARFQQSTVEKTRSRGSRTSDRSSGRKSAERRRTSRKTRDESYARSAASAVAKSRGDALTSDVKMNSNFAPWKAAAT